MSRDDLGARDWQTAPKAGRVLVRSSAADLRYSQASRPIVIVLGMHRSGTSLLANILHYLGVDMADASDRASPSNAKGFWERPQLVELHDRVLTAIGRPLTSPLHVLPFPPGWWRSHEVQSLKAEIETLLGTELMGTGGPWGFKDPRTCRLLPLWAEILRDLGLQARYVYAIRSPGEASTSMAAKNKVARPMAEAQGELMWLTYNYDILRNIDVGSVPIIEYSRWFRDPSRMAEGLIRNLDLPSTYDSNELADCLRDIVAPHLRHNTEGEDRAVSTIPISASLYRALVDTSGESSEDSTASHIALLDAMFRCMRPMVELLADLPDLRAAAAEGKASSSRTAKLSEMLEEAQRGHAKEIAAFARKLEETQREHVHQTATLTHTLAGAEQKLAMEQQSGKAALAAGEALRAELAAAERQLAAELLIRQTAEGEIARVKADAETYAAETSQRLAAAETSAADLAAALANRNRMAADIPRLRGVIEEREVEAARLIGELALARGQRAEIEGEVEGVVDDCLVGWARYRGALDRAAVVEVYVDGSFAAAAVAGEMRREDDPIAGQSRRDGFKIAIERLPLRAAPRIVRVRVAGSPATLAGSPIMLQANRREDACADGADIEDEPRAEAGAWESAGLAAGAANERGAQGASDAAGLYPQWVEQFDTLTPAADAKAWAFVESLGSTGPGFSVFVIPSSTADAVAQARTVESILAQVYSKFELILPSQIALPELPADRAKIRRVAALDFAAMLAHAEQDTVTFVSAGDTLAPTALLAAATTIGSHEEFDLLYSDEDMLHAASGSRSNPQFKSAWDPDLFLATDYASRLAVMRTKPARSAAPADPIDMAAVFAMILTHLAKRDHPVVLHSPGVLYHRAEGNYLPDDLAERMAAASARFIEDRGGVRAEVMRLDGGLRRLRWPLPNPVPLVSLVIPTRDRADLLRMCVDGLLKDTHYERLEVVIVDNDSRENATSDYFARVLADRRVKIVPYSGEFDYSAINNFGVSQCSGDVIGLLNNDIKVRDAGWLSSMVGHAIRPDVGAVGAKLLYGDGTIQHAGVVLGIGIASHIHKRQPGAIEGRGARNRVAHEASAVTAACMILRRSVWDEVGGLSTDFPVAYNDVDLCLRIRRQGYRIIMDSNATLYHLESASRGKDEAPEKRARLDADKKRLIERWAEALQSDPFYSSNLSLDAVDCAPAFPPRVRAPWVDA